MNMNNEYEPQNKLIASPCISHCCLNEQDVCLGCFRHVEEITGWHSADHDQRLEILQNSKKRMLANRSKS